MSIFSCLQGLFSSQGSQPQLISDVHNFECMSTPQLHLSFTSSSYLNLTRCFRAVTITIAQSAHLHALNICPYCD